MIETATSAEVAIVAVAVLVGMAVLDSLPDAPLRVGLGILTLGFVLTAQRAVPLPTWVAIGGSDVAKTRLGMAGVGAISGLLFGGTNVDVQLIAYLRSFKLSHGLFIDVVALVFLGLNGIRVALAGALGLYPSSIVVVASVLAAIPAVLGVPYRHTTPDGRQRALATVRRHGFADHRRHPAGLGWTWDRVTIYRLAYFLYRGSIFRR